MLGAIIGDIVGSAYEWNHIKTKDFQLFRRRDHFTDDTVMTCAVAEAVMNGGTRDDFINAMKKYGRMFPEAGYGGRFRAWIDTDDRKPYGSYGNGSAMRVSPCAWAADIKTAEGYGLPEEYRELAKLSAEVTHDHPEAIKGAIAIADAIFICRQVTGGRVPDAAAPRRDDIINECKRLVREHTEREYGYDLSRTLDEIRPDYKFDVSCKGSVPEAITAFLESTDYEDALRNAVSLGGDADTQADMAGAIAEAVYGIPERIKEKAWEYLPEPLRDVCRRWRQFVRERR